MAKEKQELIQVEIQINILVILFVPTGAVLGINQVMLDYGLVQTHTLLLVQTINVPKGVILILGAISGGDGVLLEIPYIVQLPAMGTG